MAIIVNKILVVKQRKYNIIVYCQYKLIYEIMAFTWIKFNKS
jgi:hypothetical protein